MESHLLQMRGLKPNASSFFSVDSGVASFTDAWIETTVANRTAAILKSHLLQMRGLKQIRCHNDECEHKSHLLQMRGLKRNAARGRKPIGVASFTDAWIETFL